MDGNENHTLLVARSNSTFVAKIGSSMLVVNEMTQSRILRVASKVSLTKPMYRDDIFYSGSLLRLPQYANNVNKVMTSTEWTAAVSSVPPGTTGEDEFDSAGGGACCSPGILKKMLDVSLLVSPTFLLLSISGFFTMLGLFVPFIYLKGVATESVGLTVSIATMLVSIIGIANTTGRVVAGYIADRPEINVLFLNNASVTIIGVATALVPFLNSFNALVAFACVFGLAMAFYASLRSILLVELLGLEKLTNAFGLTLLFQGIASILGTPLAGFLYEATGAYHIPFWVAGSFIIFSGVMCYPLNCVKRWEDDRNKKKDKAENNQA
ncbi:Monocarboxylate transporter 5 [Folsomia candida]|uniref:Monocarboxylate transporter 5 n=2 Tax=Folsomia candida TaxID=158441 RepID=A0A226DCE4_FOLCA|nr:Monocarboxylate transporter 5 [Folsomia candida]